MFTLLPALIHAETNSVATIKLRLGKTYVKITSNGCVASLWRSDIFSEDWIGNSIEKHISGEIKPSQINTPLMVAVARNEIENVNTILDQGADPNVINEAGCSALIWAISLDRVEIFDRLIQAKAEISLPDTAGRTPLMIAAKTGSLPMAEKLIKAGANVNAAQDGGVSEIGNTALMNAAIRKGNVIMLNLLKRYGANLDSTNEHGKTALMMAAWYGNLENVKFLVKKGSNSLIRSHKGLNSLDYAQQMQRIEVIEFLNDI